MTNQTKHPGPAGRPLIGLALFLFFCLFVVPCH